MIDESTGAEIGEKALLSLSLQTYKAQIQAAVSANKQISGITVTFADGSTPLQSNNVLDVATTAAFFNAVISVIDTLVAEVDAYLATVTVTPP